jgi:hypothetical protein
MPTAPRSSIRVHSAAIRLTTSSGVGSMRGEWKRSYGRATKAPPDERGGNRHARPTAAAPLPHSTHRWPSITRADSHLLSSPRRGALRRRLVDEERCARADKPEELMRDLPRPEDLPPGIDPPRPISVTFIPAKVFDNPVLLRVNPLLRTAGIVKGFWTPARRRREGMHGGRRPKSLEGGNRGGSLRRQWCRSMGI